MSTLGAILCIVTLAGPLVVWLVKVATAKPPPGVKPRK